ncbi:PDR/VanB family oxidoreductase [Rhodoligotrophos defluvii]|uniref:PDR/VanB family oxidoreductase n=1 Tax=Rhodoligotrophos defluvii TaxID=2561934 RepID=UPI0010C9B94F|nr:PDR/VanB family oxidoreductase [Rhodoligotrophos defluvii]
MIAASDKPPRLMTVLRKDYAAHDIALFDLADASGADLPAWEPGSHVELILSPKRGEELVRHYSLCGDVKDRHVWRIAVLREEQGRGGSQYLYDHVLEGDRIRVRGPRNNFRFSGGRKPLFIAGGIGITPLLSMMRKAAEERLDWQAVYLARTESSMIFRQELAGLDRDRVVFHDSQKAGRFRLCDLLAKLTLEHEVYACGPQRLLDDLEAMNQAGSGWQLTLERFQNPNNRIGPDDTGTFEVVLARTGVTLIVAPGQSILEVAREAGVDVDWSCCDGICGTCETRVLSGVPDHRDAILTAAEREAGTHMMICVSRARSARLVLDI